MSQNELTVLQATKLTLMQMEGQFKNALPSHINPKKFVRVAMTAISTNPKLLEAERPSLFAQLTLCAQDGLIPDGKEAAIIPYGSTVSYQPMVKGICKQAKNSGEISILGAEVVCENDDYESWIDEKGPHFKHKKARKNRGNVELTYAYAVMKDGGTYHEEINEEEMAKIEGCSKARNSPWKGPFRDEMKKKSALKRLCKNTLPSSADLDGLVDRVDDLYDFKNDEPTDKNPTEPSRTKSLIKDQDPAIETTAEHVKEESQNDEVPI